MIRKLIAPLFFVIFSNATLAQPIVGVGGINIGISTEEFLNTTPIKELKSLESLGKDKTDYILHGEDYIERISLPDPEKSTSRSTYTPGSEIYKAKLDLGIRNLSNNLWAVEFYFYKNTLVKIVVNGRIDNISEVLIEKYGKPKEKKDFKNIICQNGYGTKLSKTEGTEYKIWGNGNKIVATSSFSIWNCGEGVGSQFEISDIKTDAARSKEEQFGQKIYESQIKKDKAKKAAF